MNPVSQLPIIQNSFPPETLGALRAMNLASATVVLENRRLGLPVIQCRDGELVEVPAAEFLPRALQILETSGEPTAEQIGA